MEKLPFNIHFCIYNFLEFEKKYEMRFILEDYNQLFINDINKQKIIIKLVQNDYRQVSKKYIFNKEYFYKNLYLDKITLDRINNFETLKEQNNYIEKLLINVLKTNNKVFMIKICNPTNYIFSINEKSNKYEIYSDEEYKNSLGIDMIDDCDY
jgi:hypothetical protein